MGRRVLVLPAVVSGKKLMLILPESSRMNMTFGLTTVEEAEASGALAISTGAADAQKLAPSSADDINVLHKTLKVWFFMFDSSKS